MDRILENKTVLFIAPVFYGYEKVIVQQMETEGASVLFYPERENGIRYKFVNNFQKTALANFQQLYYSKIFQQVKDKKIDYLFVLRGFLMPLDFLQKMRLQFPDATFIMHQWDSMRNNNYEKYLDKFDRFLSFDPEDCKKYSELNYLPNFYLPQYETVNNRNSLYDISFIGWAYEDRIRLLDKICKQLPDKSIFSHIYLTRLAYFKSLLSGKLFKNVKTKTLSLNQVFKIVAQSFCILDISDINQSGYTYRAIDAMASRKKLITTNAFIKNELFYNEDNILIIDRKNPKIEEAFFNTPFTTTDLENYSLKSWVRKIFINE